MKQTRKHRSGNNTADHCKHQHAIEHSNDINTKTNTDDANDDNTAQPMHDATHQQQREQL
jgi:hypothetical protein